MNKFIAFGFISVSLLLPCTTCFGSEPDVLVSKPQAKGRFFRRALKALVTPIEPAKQAVDVDYATAFPELTVPPDGDSMNGGHRPRTRVGFSPRTSTAQLGPRATSNIPGLGPNPAEQPPLPPLPSWEGRPGDRLIPLSRGLFPQANRAKTATAAGERIVDASFAGEDPRRSAAVTKPNQDSQTWPHGTVLTPDGQTKTEPVANVKRQARRFNPPLALACALRQMLSTQAQQQPADLAPGETLAADSETLPSGGEALEPYPALVAKAPAQSGM